MPPPAKTSVNAIGLNVQNEHGRLIMPSYDALNNFNYGIDPEALAKELN